MAAETKEAAEEALNLVVVEYDELPAVFDAEEAVADGTPILHPDAPDYQAAGRRKPVPHLNLQAYASAHKGDPEMDRIFAAADLVVEDLFTGARQHQGFIEPHGCVVWIEPDGTVRVVSTNKSPFGLRQQLAKVTGLPPERIVVDSQFIGGDFGGKGTSIEEFACYYLAKATGRPIKAIMTYMDELQAGAPQHAATYWLRTAVSRDGHMLAHESRAYLNNGAYGGGRPNPETTVSGGLQCLDSYYVPNARLESFLVSTNLAPGGNMRAPGAAHRGLAGEAHVDHIARELGMDPLEFRLINAIRDGQSGLTGGPVHRPRAVEVLERLRHETAWGQRPLPPHRGRGIALRNRHVGEGRTELLYRLRPHGDIEVVTAAVDQGGGALTVIRRVAAAALSVDLERISVTYGNTSEARLDPGGVGGSRTTHVAGQAALRGAHTLKEKLEDLAAELMGWPSGQVRLEQDRFIASDGAGTSASFEEVAERVLRGGPIEVVGAYDAAEQHADDTGHQNFFAYMVEVDVDPATGRVQPTEVVLVVDVGTIINPIAHQGQLDGGFIFGYGQAATEELSHDDGRVTAPSLGEYKLPTTMDAPRLRTILLDPDPGPGPFGAKA
ncbi:MAG: molybdopterin-dependent oxidoreductase, partial [Chloroflexi bacterium]|nr:molybdopterin-dependent oxidoreductase [Chloroflexota bacterium]